MSEYPLEMVEHLAGYAGVSVVRRKNVCPWLVPYALGVQHDVCASDKLKTIEMLQGGILAKSLDGTENK